MRSCLPWRSQRCILPGAWRLGHPLGLLVMLGLVVTWYAPLPAAEPVDTGGTIVWAVQREHAEL